VINAPQAVYRIAHPEQTDYSHSQQEHYQEEQGKDQTRFNGQVFKYVERNHSDGKTFYLLYSSEVVNIPA
jgi:hypothetical protein